MHFSRSQTEGFGVNVGHVFVDIVVTQRKSGFHLTGIKINFWLSNLYIEVINSDRRSSHTSRRNLRLRTA